MPFRKVSVLTRVFAKLMDLAFAFGLAALVVYPAGPLLGFLYSVFSDGLPFKPFQGRSLGKRIMKLRVVHLPDRSRASLRDSALRNSPVGFAMFFALIPIWGWLILGLIGIPLMIMEIYLMVTVETGHRLGDVMADTEVIQA